MKRIEWVAIGLVPLALAACETSPRLIGSDLAYQLSVPPEQREACATLTDEEAIARARNWYSDRGGRRRNGPDPTMLDVLSVERTNVIVVRFGESGERRATAFIYEDCMVGWSI